MSDRSFALFERAKERSLIHSFQMSYKRAIALLQRATKRAIAHSLFFKERLSLQSQNRSLENER